MKLDDILKELKPKGFLSHPNITDCAITREGRRPVRITQESLRAIIREESAKLKKDYET